MKVKRRERDEKSGVGETSWGTGEREKLSGQRRARKKGTDGNREESECDEEGEERAVEQRVNRRQEN